VIDYLLQLMVMYGPAALAWATAFLVSVLSAHVFRKIRSDWARGVISRATDEVVDVVKSVFQSYVEGIKAGRATGGLSQDEKVEARNRAWREFSSNLGTKGLKRLARVIGIDVEDVGTWFDSKAETAIAVSKEAARRDPLRMRSPAASTAPASSTPAAAPSP
jgi:hypothetical protein